MSRKGFASSGRKDAFSSSASLGSGFDAFSSLSPLSYLAEPPDFSALDPHVTVSFKSLSLKKDDATKARALGEIVAFVKENPFVDGTGDAILEAWVKLYPRTAVDSSGRVRELSHSLQYELMLWGRRRMEKQLPKIVGTWLAGAFDRHKPASRAANEGLTSFLNTPDKKAMFWKKCQKQILDYATEAAQETVDTLSDDKERAAKPAEARSKFLRAIGGALALVTQLFDAVDEKARAPAEDQYDKFLSLNQVWEMASVEDSGIRKNVYQLLSICLEHKEAVIESALPRLRRNIIYDGLRCDQTGSSTEYVRTLTRLTTRHPSIWSISEKGKKSPKKSPIGLLQTFVEKGSQGGAGVFWVCLDKLLSIIPQDLTYDEAAAFAHSMRSGVSNRLEPRSNAAEGWACYIELARRFSDQLGSEGPKLIQESLFPLANHYINQEGSVWSSGAQLPVLLRAYKVSARPISLDLLCTSWDGLADTMASQISSSLPEQSKDYHKSQQVVSDAGGRWFTLVGAIFHGELETRPVHGPSNRLISECCDALERRNFKPFGAASTLLSAVRKCPALINAKESNKLVELVRDNMDRVLCSPSSPYLFSSISALGNSPNTETQSFYHKTWPAIVEAVLKHESEPGVVDAITTLVSSGEETAELARSDQDLQEYIANKCIASSEGQGEAWSLFETVYTFGTLTPGSTSRIATSLVGKLNPGEDCADALRGLEIIAQRRPDTLTSNETVHVNLVTKLLSMTSLSDQRAANIKMLLDQTKSTRNKSPAITIIQSNLSSAGPQTLDVDTLVEQALLAAKTGMASVESLLPSLKAWMQELLPFFQVDPNPAVSVSNILRGAQFLVPTSSGNRSIRTSRRDRYGASVPARMAMYTAALIGSGIELSSLPIGFQVDVVYFLLLTQQLASEQQIMDRDEMLWQTMSKIDASAQVDGLRASVNKLIVKVSESEWVPGSLMGELVKVMVEETKELKPANLYTARALANVFQIFASKYGFSGATENLIVRLDVFNTSVEHALGAVAVLGGFSDLLSSSKPVINFCNKMVSEMLGANPTDQKTLVNLVLLNAAASVFDSGTLPVANNRLVFAAKHITSWFADPEQIDHAVATEACRALQNLLPCMESVYGSYWEDSIGFIAYLVQRAEGDLVDLRLSYVHAALKLESTLQGLESPNDDLVDALQSSAKERSLAVLDLLALPRGPSSDPQLIVESLVCQRANKIPLKYIKDLSDICPLVESESEEIQSAAFNLLHKVLPEQQQQISVDVVLDKTSAQLPDELISLLLEPPTLEQYSDDALALFPTSVRAYLLTWHLVFDAFSTASHKVRDDYTSQLKERNFLTPLLDFMFDVLGHSAASPLQLEREGFDSSHITSYPLHLAATGVVESEEKSMHWLLLHVFYLVLTYVPGLFRTWHINCKRKATKIAVRDWTEKYYSPLIVTKALDDVAEWAKSGQDLSGAGTDESELNIRVNKSAREVVAGYEVDEVEACMSIKLAADFPLGGVTVNGLKRVVVAERKWQSWMIITQGVIMFSNGNIISGLTVFRKNIVGALKGHTECAICFSIISEDNKTPEKRCGTCKHMFHKYCLYKWLSSSNQNSWVGKWEVEGGK
ncbi:RING zinc finger [Zalerion maritima]|uniref:E3 ubiquitin-protein ligase listerin n=1 Tax=Zalerion maritima TaxID=339359 RepID=A0AAD5RMM8_9PEZI|nr:RING zinc finger [Zalerion maritima]